MANQENIAAVAELKSKLEAKPSGLQWFNCKTYDRPES